MRVKIILFLCLMLCAGVAWGTWGSFQALQSGAAIIWDISANQVGHWKLNDDAANGIVVDSEGANEGAYNQNTSAGSVAGKINKALTFNGTSLEISLGTSATLDLSVQTIVMWMKTTDNTAGFLYFNPTDFTYDGCFYSIGGSVRFAYDNVTSWGTADLSLDDNAWHQVVVYSDGTLGNTEFWVDGAPVAGSSTGSQSSDRTGNVYIGARAGTAIWFDGLIDYVRLLDRKITDAEVMGLYNGGSGTEADSGS